MNESSFLPISALQHYVFCPRQCAIIHLEQNWVENTLTAQGRVDHRIVHEVKSSENVSHNMPVHSFELGLVGILDVVEFKMYNNNKIPIPIEYKHGSPKKHHADEVQLCAQAICLEEMLKIKIPYGEIFYIKKKKRYTIDFDDQLRKITKDAVKEMHDMFRSQNTPLPVFTKYCKSCSLYDQCYPEIFSSNIDIKDWIGRKIIE